MQSEDDDSQYILNVQTSQCTKFKGVIGVIKDLLFDCNIHFDEAGMKICNLDNVKVALVHLRLSSGEDGCFSKFYCPKPIVLGVSITALHKYLGYITQNNKYTIKLMVFKETPHELVLELDNDMSTEFQRFYMKLLDLPLDQAGLDPEKFECLISMPSGKFQSYCNSHALVGDVMDIITAGDTVRLLTVCDGREGQGDRSETVIRTTSADNEEEVDGDENTAKPMIDPKRAASRTSLCLNDRGTVIAGRFSLKFLKMFAKAQSLSPNVEIYFKQEFPLVLLYRMRDFGHLKFALAPQVHPLTI